MNTETRTPFYPWTVRTTISPARTAEEGEAADIGYALDDITAEELDAQTLELWEYAEKRRIRTTSRKILDHYRHTLRTFQNLWETPIDAFSFGLLAADYCDHAGINGDSISEDGVPYPYIDDDEIILDVARFYRRTVERFIRQTIDAPEPVKK